MARYVHGLSYIKNWRFFVATRRILIVVLIILLIGIAVVFVDTLLIGGSSDKPSDLSEETVSTILPSIEIFSTSFFQFQTDKNWRFIANESTDNVFAYRRINNGLVEADLTIYVNKEPTKPEATRVLPVYVAEGSYSMDSTIVSDHCRNSIPIEQRENIGNIDMSLLNVELLCDFDGNDFTIVAGLENGTTHMDLNRPDGSKAQYMIYFNDLRFSAKPDEFVSIINTFQVR